MKIFFSAGLQSMQLPLTVWNKVLSYGMKIRTINEQPSARLLEMDIFPEHTLKHLSLVSLRFM